MRLAFSSLACPDWTVERIAESVSRYGYDGIEWRIAEGEPISPGTPPEVVRRVVAATRERGLTVVALDSSCRLAQLEPAARRATVEEARFMLGLARELGAPGIRVFGGDVPPGIPLDRAAAAAAETLTAIAEVADPLGVRVLVETHDPIWSLSRNLLAVLDGVHAPGIGVVYDILHPFRRGEPVEETLTALGARIELVHLKDGRRPADASETWQLCAVGEGDMPIGAVLAGLGRMGYEGWYTFEWEKRWHPELDEPELALPAAAAALRAMVAA